MSAPKHLWSGDWQRESDALTDELAGRRARPRPDAPPPPPVAVPPRPVAAPPRPVFAPPPPPTSPPPSPRPASPPPRDAPAPRRDGAAPPRARRRRSDPPLLPRLRQALPVVLAVVLLFAAGAYGLSSVLSSSGSPAAATVSPPNGPIRWLGMQIASVTPGTAVIETVAPGSSGERAGLEPGDILVAVNGRPITAPEQIAGAVSALRPGAYVEVQVNRGSTPFIAQAVLVGPPSNHP